MVKNPKTVFCRIVIACLLVLSLTGCGNTSAEKAYPPSEETVQAAAEKLGWTIDQEGTQSWAENHILYSLVSDHQPRAAISIAQVDGNRLVNLHCFGDKTTEKPEFSWEDWKEAIALVESLYGGLSEGELYEYLRGQDSPEAETESSNTSLPGLERLRWVVDCPTGYGWADWSVRGVRVEYGFGGRLIREWAEQLTVSLYESKEFYESTHKKA